MYIENLKIEAFTEQYVKYRKSDIFILYGVRAKTTDFAYALGSRKNEYIFSDPCAYGRSIIVDRNGYILDGNPLTRMRREYGIRPILDYSLSSLPSDRLTRNKAGILELRYGYMPQSAAPKIVQKKLNDLCKKGDLEKTENLYTIDTRDSNSLDEPILAQLLEYSFGGKRYVKIHSNFYREKFYEENFESKKYKLSNDVDYSFNEDIWFEVKPIYWYVDEKNKLLISKDILLGGIRCDDFNNTFLEEICQIEKLTKENGNSTSIIVPSLPNQTIMDTPNYEEQLEKFKQLEMEQLDLNPMNITTFGSELSEHAQAISSASFGIIDIMDNNSIYDIKNELKNINQKKSSKSIFSKNYTLEEITKNNKKILTNLKNSLSMQQTVMVNQTQQFDYTKKLIASFVNRLNNYIEVIKKALEELKNSDNTLNEFEQANKETMLIILQQQLHDYEKAKLTHTIQYKNIDLLFRNYAVSLSKIITYINATLPSVYTAVAISNGILAQQESLDSIKEIDTLLDDIVSYNNEYLNNKKQIENLDESAQDMLANEGLINLGSVNDEKKVFIKN